MIDKVVSSIEEAIADVHDGASIMIGGLGMSGTPHNLVKVLGQRGVKNLTMICNSYATFVAMENGSHVKKVIVSFAASPYSGARRSAVAEQILAGEIEVELVPQGTLAERIRAGGAGIAAFYTPTGTGTVVDQGKEKMFFDGKEHLLERGLTADFAFIKAYKSDTKGNLVYRMAMRNFNPVMAMAARVTIAEVQEIVPAGQLDPEHVVTPGIFVDRVVRADPIVIEFRSPLKKQ